MSHSLPKMPPVGAVISLALLLAQVAMGRAQEKFDFPPVAENAALQYWQGFAKLPALDAKQEKLLDNWAKEPLGVATSSLLDQCQDSLKFLHRGAKLRKCDWGLDYSDGISMQLPHLSKARTLARVAALDARRALAVGNTDAAGNDMVGIVAMARHIGSDTTLVSALVCFAMEGMVVDLAAPLIPELNVPYDEALKAFESLPPRPRLDVTLAGDKRLASSMIQQLLDAERQRPGSWLETWLAMLGPNGPESLKHPGSLEEITKQLEGFFATYDELAKLVVLPPAEFEAQFPPFVKRARAANRMADLLLPSVDQALMTFRRGEARMAMLLAAIAVVESGPEKLAEIKDPFGDGPFGYKKLETGFELSSKLMEQGRPVTLTIGPQEE
jgi:hypothetical protein